MNGKSKCKILKDIRKRIAEENDIEYITSECTYQGNCKGTCPKCEAELRYLEAELNKRRNAGKAVAVAGIAATVMLTSTGCDVVDNIKEKITDKYKEEMLLGAVQPVPSEEEEVLDGDVELIDGEVSDEEY